MNTVRTTTGKGLLLAALLASATFASSGAFAQAPQGSTTAPTPPAAEAQAVAPDQGKHMRHTGADREKRFEHMQQRRAQHMAALKEKLKLTPAQEGAWSTFAEAQRPPVRPGAGEPSFDRGEFAKLTTPQRLERMQARQAERSAMFAKRADATRSFYATLSPQQQKTFDAESMMPFGHGEHGEHHRHGPAPTKG